MFRWVCYCLRPDKVTVRIEVTAPTAPRAAADLERRFDGVKVIAACRQVG